MLRCVWMPLLALCLSLPAAAQIKRPFPANALRGLLIVTQPPEALLNGEAVRLAPGARIRDAANLQQLSGTLVGQKLLVHYTLDGTGLVQAVWVLTPEEADRKPWPTTPEQARSWVFDPATQTWTRP